MKHEGACFFWEKSGSNRTKGAVQYDGGFPMRAVSAKVMI